MMSSMKKIIAFSVGVLLLSTFMSCAALTRYKCNREYAAKKGMEDAEAGRTSQPAKLEGGSCEGDYSASSFTKDYLYGYDQKKAEVCHSGMATTLGRLDGEAGNLAKPQKAKLQLCSDMRDFAKYQTTYDNEFQKSYCGAARIAKTGTEHGAALQASDYDSAFSSCGPKMKKTYTDAYKKGVLSFCTIDQAEKMGAADAAAKKSMEEGLSKYGRCVEMGKPEVKKAFQRSFEDAQVRIRNEEADRLAAENQRLAQEQERIRLAKLEDFRRNVAHSSFVFQNKMYYANCSVGGDKSFIQVDVENPNAQQVLIQGNWKVIYHNANFAKITEDRTVEAVLLTPNNRKSFQKMTLPRDAEYCRAEFVGSGRM